MSSFLYRLGHAVVRRARRVLALAVAALVLVGGLAFVLGGQLQDDLTIPGTESQKGLDVLAQRFPEVAGTNGQVLFVAPRGDRITEHKAEVRAVVKELRRTDHVIVATDPFEKQNRLMLAENGRDALVQVQLDVPLDRLQKSTIADLEDAAQTLPASSELDVHLGGQLFAKKTVPVSITEAAGVLVALLVLVVTFGSILAAGMPILTALLGVGISMSGLLAMAAFVDINTSTPSLAMMIGLAVGIDYALFIVSRHRGQLARGMDPAESVAQSVATAGSAVIFAGATVVVALCGLVVSRIPFLAIMGYAAAGAVGVAVLVALTVVPALLGLAGERLRPKPGSRAARNAVVGPDETHTLGARWVRLVTRVPLLTVVLVAAVLVVMALPARDLTLGLPDNGSSPKGSTERTTYDLVTRDYGPGFNTPLLVTADIVRTRHPVAVMKKLGNDIEGLAGVRAVALTTPNRTADLGIVQIIPDKGQTDPATSALVRHLREIHPQYEQKYGISQVRVTGQTAVAIDVSDRLSGALVPFGFVVVGFSLLLLMLVFRSIAVPVKATLGYLFSVGASFGAVTAVFQWGWFADTLHVPQVGPVVSFMPIMLMGVLFGLAMDYEVFLVSRMREDFVHSGAARQSVLTGFTGSARVVTAAAVIMISVFAAFVPHGDVSVQPIALGLAVGVFVDAFLVRMMLVPAVLALLGDRAWWLPGWLDRRLPELDIEGAGIRKHVEHDEWVAEHGAAVVRAENLRIGDGDDVLVDALDVVLRDGDVLVAAGGDRVARRAVLATLSGRLAPTQGRLFVLGRVLPEEATAVRRRVALHRRFPTRRGRHLRRRPALLVVDDVDAAGLSPTEVEERWELLADAAAAGVTVVAGCTELPPDQLRPAQLVGLDHPTEREDRDLDATLRLDDLGRAPEEATL